MGEEGAMAWDDHESYEGTALASGSQAGVPETVASLLENVLAGNVLDKILKG